MATMVTGGAGTHIPAAKQVARVIPIRTSAAARTSTGDARTSIRRRSVSPESGRALEILGHAIEYLYDEFALESISGDFLAEKGTNSRIAAIDLLKRLNREVYFSCPLTPTLGQRFRSFFARSQQSIQS